MRDAPQAAEGERGGEEPESGPDTLRPEEENAAGASLREQVFQKKQDEQKQLDEEKKRILKKEADASSGFSELSRNGLRWAWGALATVAGFPLGFAYINAHVFLRFVFGEKLFCKLGNEWTPSQLYARSVGGGAGKSIVRSVGIMEVMTLLLLDIIVGVIVFGLLAIIVMILTWMSEFNEAGVLTKGWIILKGIWDLGFGGMKALVGLFSV